MQKNKIGLLFALGFIVSFIGGHAVQAATTYTVEKGDTLWEIAHDNNTSVENLLLLNELNSALIFPEQEIKIDHQQQVYTVQKGDTLSEIAVAHNISLTDLKKWNNIAGHLIFPGEQLTLQQSATTIPASGTNGWTKAASPTLTPDNKGQQQTPQKQVQNKQPTTSVEQTPTAVSGKEMTVTATAYTAYCEGCSGTTYTGINLRANPNQKVIAVDPSVIPLGSRVWVEGYGEAIAGDIGGAIKGNIIDVFLEQKQDALNWGRKTVKIKILD